MRYWEYQELIDCIKESYDEFYASCTNKEHALARIANEYINMGDIEDIIVDVTISEIMISEQELISDYIKGISERLNKFDSLNLNNDLSEKEWEDLRNRISKVINYFNEIIYLE